MTNSEKEKYNVKSNVHLRFREPPVRSSIEPYLECTVGGIAYDMGEDESTRFEVYLEMENGIHGVKTTPVVKVYEVHCHPVQGEITNSCATIDLFELTGRKPSDAIRFQ